MCDIFAAIIKSVLVLSVSQYKRLNIKMFSFWSWICLEGKEELVLQSGIVGQATKIGV